MLDGAPQHNDRISLARKRTSKQEGISSGLGTATGRYGSRDVETQQLQRNESQSRERCKQDEVERTRITKRHVRKVRSPGREPCGCDSRSENKVKDRQGSIARALDRQGTRAAQSRNVECAA